MSLEQAITDNTTALHTLIDLLKAGNLKAAEPVITEAKIGSVGVKTDLVKPDTVTEAAKTTETPSYETVSTAFLELVNKDRNRAVAILAAHGAKNLKLVEESKLFEVYEQVQASLKEDSLV